MYVEDDGSGAKRNKTSKAKPPTKRKQKKWNSMELEWKSLVDNAESNGHRTKRSKIDAEHHQPNKEVCEIPA